MPAMSGRRLLRIFAIALAAWPASAAADDPVALAGHSAAEWSAACARALAHPATPATTNRWRNAGELLAAVHPDADVRRAATACIAAIDAAGAPAARGPVAAMQARLAALEREFQRRLTEHEPRLRFTRAEVAGMPDAWRTAHRASGTGERYEVGVGLAEYHEFMQMADDPAARRRMYFAHANRGGAANPRTLQRIADLRRAIARAQGWPSHYASVAARYALPPPDSVAGFLAGLQGRVDGPAAADVGALARFAAGARPARLARWDAERMLELARAAVVGQGDTAPEARLPAELLLPWLEAWFGRLAKVRFGPPQPAPWHASASCLPVARDAPDAAPLGLLCLDTAPRAGKYYNYATHFVPEAGDQPRMAVVVANLEAGALLPDEVQRSFAEFSVALAQLTCAGPRCPAITDPLGLASSTQRGFFGPLAFSDEALAVLRETAPGPLFPAAVAADIRVGGSFAAGLQFARQLEIARFDFELADARAPISVVRRWAALEAATPLGYVPGTLYLGRLNMVASPPGGTYYTALWAQAASLELWRRWAGRTLAADVAPQVRAAFFEPGAEGTPGLADTPPPLAGLGELIEQNTIAAVAERRRQQRLTLDGRR